MLATFNPRICIQTSKGDLVTSFEMRGCIARLLRDIFPGTDRFDPRMYEIYERVIIMQTTYALQY